MSNLKVNAKTKPLEFKRKHNELVDEIPVQIANALVADKDIISKIRKEYNEDDNITYIILPKGIIPLSITLNNHTLFFLNYHAVNNHKQEVDGYEIYEMVITDIESSYIAFVGDLTEQVINDLVYINFDSNNREITSFKDSYYLFYPITESGTKLYKHVINFNAYGETTPFPTITYTFYSTHNEPVTKEEFVEQGTSGRFYIMPKLQTNFPFTPAFNIQYQGQPVLMLVRNIFSSGSITTNQYRLIEDTSGVSLNNYSDTVTAL